MASGNDEISSHQRQRDWLNSIANEFEKIEPFAVEWNLSDEDGPSWLANVERKFAEDTFPLAKLKTVKALTPKFLGSILGQQCAYAVWLMEWMNTQSEQPEIESNTTLTEEDIAKFHAFKTSFEKWYDGLRKLAKKSLCTSVDQTYGDMSDFLSAYSAGFAKKPMGFRSGNIGSTTFEIYVFLLLYWPYVQRMTSVSQLHAVLQKVLGQYRTGDLKRIEQICRRIDLHFRKPGRPKKAE